MRLVSVVLAVSLLLLASYVHILGNSVRSWPTTTGKLEQKSVVGFGGGSRFGSNEYAVYILYSYHVGDRTLIGSNARVWDMTFNRRSLAEDYLQDGKVGTEVVVYYNPADPEQSYLSTAYPVTPVLMLILGAGISGAIGIFSARLSRFLSRWSISTAN
jgi:hypothetical protein